MKTLNFKERIIIGFTLFSMFFGAGNLIFPPLLGAEAGGKTVVAMVGLLITAVLLPILAVAAVAKHDNLKKLCSKIHPLFGSIFTILVCLMIGPFVAIPRTASTSFEMVVTPFLSADFSHMTEIRIIYSFLFFIAAVFIASRPNKLKDILGKIMTPVLIILILVLFVSAYKNMPYIATEASSSYREHTLFAGFITGYQTMDILAALNFGIIIALNIEDFGVEDKVIIAKETVKAGIFAGVMLAIVYFALSYIGAVSGIVPEALDRNITGADILSYVIYTCLGNTGRVIAALVFFIACFDVSCGLLSSCSKYFNEVFPKISYKTFLRGFAIFSFVVSSAGLYHILAFSFPVLKVMCPLAILIVIFGFIKKR